MITIIRYFLLSYGLLHLATTRADTAPEIPVRALSEFVSVFERVRTEHVQEHTDESLLKLALEGLMLKLDPYSEYLDEDATQILKETTSGTFVGIGIDIAPSGHNVIVIAPIDDSPAAKAGILAGDQITHIDGTHLKGKGRSQVYQLLSGPKGSNIELTIFRQGQELTFNLTRALVQSPSIRSKLLPETHIGYIRIGIFQEDTGSEVLNKLIQLKAEGAKAWLLDLRNNPGGILHSGASVANVFLANVPIVTTRGRQAHNNLEFNADAEDPSGGLPTLVMINRGSASSAEIVSAALQENGRAKLAGQTSFGKGSVQSVIALDETRSIRLTTAYYYTPDGNSLNGTGIKPDFPIDSNLDDDATLDTAIALLQQQIANND